MPRRGGPPARPRPARQETTVPPTVEEVYGFAVSADAMRTQTRGWAAAAAAASGDTDLADALASLAETAGALAGDASTLSRLMIRYGYPAAN